MKTFRIFFYTFLIGLVFSSCAKEYSSEVLAAPTGSWQFTAGNTTYSGYISDFHINNGTTNQYSFTGKTKDGSQTFLMNLYADTLVTGAYAASQFQATLSYTDISGASIYTANQQVGEFVVNLTSVDSTNINATFSGTAADAGGNDVQITNGKLTIN
ncbi:MAG: hypothetical protein ACTHK0_00640 [Ginsengibacter sp.]